MDLRVIRRTRAEGGEDEGKEKGQERDEPGGRWRSWAQDGAVRVEQVCAIFSVSGILRVSQ